MFKNYIEKNLEFNFKNVIKNIKYENNRKFKSEYDKYLKKKVTVHFFDKF